MGRGAAPEPIDVKKPGARQVKNHPRYRQVERNRPAQEYPQCASGDRSNKGVFRGLADERIDPNRADAWIARTPEPRQSEMAHGRKY